MPPKKNPGRAAAAAASKKTAAASKKTTAASKRTAAATRKAAGSKPAVTGTAVPSTSSAVAPAVVADDSVAEIDDSVASVTSVAKTDDSVVEIDAREFTNNVSAMFDLTVGGEGSSEDEDYDDDYDDGGDSSDDQTARGYANRNTLNPDQMIERMKTMFETSLMLHAKGKYMKVRDAKLFNGLEPNYSMGSKSVRKFVKN